MKKLLFILLSIQMLFALEIKEIKKGDIIEDSVERLEKKYYSVDINYFKNIRATLTNLSNDVDIYVRSTTLDDLVDEKSEEERLPTIRKNDCYSSNSNTNNEECYYNVKGIVPLGETTKVYILVYGFKAASYRLEVKEEAEEIIEEITAKPINAKVKKGESKQYKIYGEPGQTISATLFNLTADADLRLKTGRKAKLRTFDCKSTKGGTKTDSCSVTLKKGEYTVYIQVYGFRSADYSITGGIVDKVNNQADLITHAKKQCVANETSNKYDILCSSEENIVFMIDSQTSPDHIDRQLYRVDIGKNNEEVTLIKTVKHRKGQYLSSFSFNEKWDNTPLFVLESINSMKMGNYCLYGPNGKSQFCNAYAQYGEWNNIRKEKPIYEVTADAKKLIVTQKTFNRDIANSEKTIRKIYDITNPNKVKLISTEEI